MEYVCYGLILHFFSLSSFPLPFCSGRDFEWNTNHEFSFLFLDFSFRQNRVRKLVMDVFSIGDKMDLRILKIRMRIARRRC